MNIHAPPSQVVRYVGVADMVELVVSRGVENMLKGMAEYIEEDFRRWPLFDKTPRVASHSTDGVIELMPTSDGTLYAFKYVNGHPKNTREGLQTVTAFGVLADVATGYPTFLSEMTITTALRTAATSAVAARHLARPDAAVMAMIGLGAQSEFQAHAFRAICGISTLRVYDIDAEATRKFLANMAGQGFEISDWKTAAEAVIGADIITTCTADKQNATVLSDNMVGAGVHINAIGGDCPGKTELQADILHRAAVFVEYPEQTRIEGEIQQMDPDIPVTELWRVICGQADGRTGKDQITLFDSVGFATEDLSALRFIRDAVEGTHFYAEIDLITAPSDPRNLYGMILNATETIR